jgi:hypothetical protein
MASIIKQFESVTAQNVIIDKLAITFDVPASQVKLIATRLRNIAQESFGRFCGSKNYELGANIYMNENQMKDFSTSSCVTVHTQPRFAEQKSCRIEWNPAKVSAEIVSLFVFNEMLELDFSLIESGTVTRIDLAIDVDNAQIDDILFFAPKFQLFENRYKSGLTRYIGGRWGQRYFCCYDKRAEIIDHNKRVHALHKIDVPNHPRMRIEARLRPKILWNNLVHTTNPFETLKVRQFSADASAGDSANAYFPLFLAHARYVGLNAALAKLPKRHKKRMRDEVLETQDECGWWQPKKLWNGFYDQYENIDSFVRAVDCNQAVG